MAKGSTRKLHKSAVAERKPEEVDRVSSLPDELLCHILSFLPTKESIATSVLSTRWRSLWTLVCTLDFDDNCPSFSKNDFVKVVNDVLAQRKAKYMKRLCLSGHNKRCKPHLLTSLVSLATEQNVEELDLCYVYVETTLPCRIFTCQTLSFLKLEGGINLDLPSSVHLPFLKILHLCLLCFVDDESIMRLLSGCPVLEELHYKELKFNRTTSFGIRVPSLKRLHVTSKDQRLQINAPNLQYLQLENTRVTNYVVENFENIEEAHLDIFFDHEDQKENIPKLFYGIQKTRFMCLSYCSTEVLTYACLEFPVFHNLAHLQLSLCTLDSYFLVELLLEKCPKLEVLDIQKVHETFDNEIEWTRPTIAVPSCLSSHLTTFKFREYGGTQEELKVVGYFLESGKVLKTTTIHFASWLEAENLSRVVSKLYALPRASKDCRTKYQFLN